MDQREPIIWEALEHEHRPKTTDWYWALGIIAFGGATTALIAGNTLFALLILIGAFTMMLLATKHPTLTRFEINNRGVIIKKTLYPYSSLHSYGIPHENPLLILRSKKTFVPFIIIPLGDIHPSEIEDVLHGHLPREEHEEPFAHKILEYFGF